MRPRAIRKHAMVRGSDGLLRPQIEGRECILDSFAELVWGLADGSRTIEALARAAGQACNRVVPGEEVFSVLDFLADAGLIEQRVAPPVVEANVSRRVLLARIAPVVGAAMITGISARGNGLIQSEGSSKESHSKESLNKSIESSNKESSNKEQNNKAAHRESSSKLDSNTESNNKMFNRNEHDGKATLREDNNLVHHSAVPVDIQKIKTSWPKIYEVVGHKLSEFPELLEVWKAATASNPKLTIYNQWELFKQSEKSFQLRLVSSPAATALFINAGFDVGPDFIDSGPVLLGDKEKKTSVGLSFTGGPINKPAYNWWRYTLNADYVRIQFHSPEAAYQVLTARQATETEKR